MMAEDGGLPLSQLVEHIAKLDGEVAIKQLQGVLPTLADKYLNANREIKPTTFIAEAKQFLQLVEQLTHTSAIFTPGAQNTPHVAALIFHIFPSLCESKLIGIQRTIIHTLESLTRVISQSDPLAGLQHLRLFFQDCIIFLSDATALLRYASAAQLFPSIATAPPSSTPTNPPASDSRKLSPTNYGPVVDTARRFSPHPTLVGCFAEFHRRLSTPTDGTGGGTEHPSVPCVVDMSTLGRLFSGISGTAALCARLLAKYPQFLVDACGQLWDACLDLLTHAPVDDIDTARSMSSSVLEAVEVLLATADNLSDQWRTHELLAECVLKMMAFDGMLAVPAQAKSERENVAIGDSVADRIGRCVVLLWQRLSPPSLARFAVTVGEAVERCFPRTKSRLLKKAILDAMTATMASCPQIIRDYATGLLSILGKASVRPQVARCLDRAVDMQLRISEKGLADAGDFKEITVGRKRKAVTNGAQTTTAATVTGRSPKRRKVGVDGRCGECVDTVDTDGPHLRKRQSPVLDVLVRHALEDLEIDLGTPAPPGSTAPTVATNRKKRYEQSHAVVAMTTVVQLAIKYQQHDAISPQQTEQLFKKVEQWLVAMATPGAIRPGGSHFTLRTFQRMLELVEVLHTSGCHGNTATAVSMETLARVCLLPWSRDITLHCSRNTTVVVMDTDASNGGLSFSLSLTAGPHGPSPALVGGTDQAASDVAVPTSVAKQQIAHVMCRCLELLALFAPQCTPSERKQAFAESLADTRIEVATAAVRQLPQLLFRLGKQHVSDFILRLMPLAAKQDVDTAALEAVANAVGMLACVSADAAACKTVTAHFPERPSVHVVCTICDNTHKTQPPTVATATPLPFDLWRPFFTELLRERAGGAAGRVAFLESSFPRILRHVFAARSCRDDDHRFLYQIWLQQLSANDRHVRMAASAATRVYAATVGASDLRGLFEALANAQTTADSGTRETLLCTIGHLCAVADSEIFPRMVELLVTSLGDDSLHVRTAAHEALQYAARSRGFSTPADMLRTHAQAVVPLVVGKMLAYTPLLEEVASSLFDTDACLLLEEMLPHSLPALVAAGDAASAAPLLAELARRLTEAAYTRHNVDHGDTEVAATAVTVPGLLLSNLRWLLPRLLVDASDPDRAVAVVETLSRVPLVTIATGCLYEALLELIGQLGVPANEVRERAKNGIVKLFELAGTRPQPTAANGSQPIGMRGGRDELLADLLTLQFFPIAEMITSTLLDRRRSSNANAVVPASQSGPHGTAAAGRPASVSEKQRLLRGFEELLRIIRPHLSKLRPKVMAVLKLVMKQQPALVAMATDVWYTFVTLLEPLQLGASLATIVVDLLPYLESCGDQVVRVLQYLFVAKRDVLFPYFKELANVYIPDLPALRDVHMAITTAAQHGDAGRQGDAAVCDQIRALLRGIQQSANDNLRNFALRKLAHQVLPSAQPALVAMVMTDGPPPPLVSDIIRVLLVCGRDASTETRLRVAECLGELGAVDPGRVDVVGLRPDLPEDKSDDALATELVRDYLVKALLRNDTRVQDRAAYAIQEILRFCGCTAKTPAMCEEIERDLAASAASTPSRRTAASGGGGGRSGRGGTRRSALSTLSDDDRRAVEIWRNFADDVRELLVPFLSSEYSVMRAAPLPPSPLYAHTRRSYNRWVCLWTAHLIDKSKGSKQTIFHACREMCLSRADTSVAQYLLPYALLNVLQLGSDEDRAEIKNEILAVLEDTAGGAVALATEGTNANAATTTATSNPTTMGALNLHASSSTSLWTTATAAVAGASSFPATPDVAQLCAQTVFNLIDLLSRWVEQKKAAIANAAKSTSTGAAASSRSSRAAMRPTAADGTGTTATASAPVEKLLRELPPLLMATAAFRCKAYARAVMCFEAHIRSEMRRLASEAPGKQNAAHADVLSTGNLSTLLRFYAGTDEPDGLAGIAYWLRQVASVTARVEHLEEHITVLTKAGNWADALICHDHALQKRALRGNSEAMISAHLVGMLKCLRNLGQFETMLSVVKGNLSLDADSAIESESASTHPRPHIDHAMCTFGIQAAWRLSRWDLVGYFLDKLETSPDGSTVAGNFEISLGRILLALHRGRVADVRDQLAAARADVIGPLLAAGMDSYHRAYPYMIKLHMLRELEQALPLVAGAVPSNATERRAGQLFADWSARLLTTQFGVKFREPVLMLRRVLLGMLDMREDVADAWMTSAKMYRKVRHFQSATSALVQTSAALLEARCHGDVGTEMAKLLWDRGDHHAALLQIKEELSRHVNPDVPHSPRQRARQNILTGKWLQQTGHSSHAEMKRCFENAVKMLPNWEKPHFFLGKYYDVTLATLRKAGHEQNAAAAPAVSTSGSSLRGAKQTATSAAGGGAASAKTAVTLPAFKEELLFVQQAVIHYGTSLCNGHRYIYQSLPRLLTLWCDYGAAWMAIGADVAGTKGATVKQFREAEEMMRELKNTMQGLAERIAPHQWLTAFSQLTSRICHRNPDVYEVLESIMQSVLQAFPQQSAWMMVALLYSSVPTRVERAEAIFEQAKTSGAEVRKILDDAGLLTQNFIMLCEHMVPRQVHHISLNKEFRNLVRTVPVSVIVPLQNSLTVSLPERSPTDESFVPFPPDLPTIEGFEDMVPLMASLQRPKKVTILGSDGRKYIFLFKPHDDLRKDSRMMEFNAVVNKLLKRTPDGRGRALHVRTYAVVPLNERVGLIEWVKDTTGLKHIVNALHTADGLIPDMKQVRPILEPMHKVLRRDHDAPKNITKHQAIEQLLPAFRDIVLPMYPPVFYRWFLSSFPEPSRWFDARLAYARSLAVMSMIGYIVGLGDRHGENILLDSNNGECVHVDLNCLFWKGETLAQPELVPFRLTQNMTDALGLTGYEGVFRKVCEITLGVLRANRDTLMSVLEPFIYDPLVEWKAETPTTTSRKNKAAVEESEAENEHALTHLTRIDLLLQGRDEPGLLPLSVEGQVHQQIMAATNPVNLCQMYIGWAAWI